MTRIIFIIASCMAAALDATGAGNENEKWYKCTAYGSSHTGRYTFRINKKACQVYWLEIDTQLKSVVCSGDIIRARKPSGRTVLDIVFFNMGTGYFYDYVSGVYDRGNCRPAAGLLKKAPD